MSEKNIIEMVNISGQSEDNGDRWIMEKMRSDPHTITIPRLKTCTTRTRLPSLWISIVKDDTAAGVLREWTVCNNMSWVVAKGAKPVQTDTRDVAEVVAKRTVASSTTILGMTRGALSAIGTLILWTVDTKMPHNMTLKTASLMSHCGFWAQMGISRCNSSGVRGGSALMKDRTRVSGNI